MKHFERVERRGLRKIVLRGARAEVWQEAATNYRHDHTRYMQCVNETVDRLHAQRDRLKLEREAESDGERLADLEEACIHVNRIIENLPFALGGEPLSFTICDPPPKSLQNVPDEDRLRSQGELLALSGEKPFKLLETIACAIEYGRCLERLESYAAVPAFNDGLAVRKGRGRAGKARRGNTALVRGIYAECYKTYRDTMERKERGETNASPKKEAHKTMGRLLRTPEYKDRGDVKRVSEDTLYRTMKKIDADPAYLDTIRK